jgi:hypothetical protein
MQEKTWAFSRFTRVVMSDLVIHVERSSADMCAGASPGGKYCTFPVTWPGECDDNASCEAKCYKSFSKHGTCVRMGCSCFTCTDRAKLGWGIAHLVWIQVCPYSPCAHIISTIMEYTSSVLVNVANTNVLRHILVSRCIISDKFYESFVLFDAMAIRISNRSVQME